MIRALLVSRVRRSSELVALAVASLLMVVSGLVHVHLWDIAYRHVATLGPLFLVQAVAAFVAAVLVVATRRTAVALAAALLMIGTIAGFVLAATVGIFGFKLPEVTGWAYLALATELVSFVILVTVAARQARAGAGDGVIRHAGL